MPRFVKAGSVLDFGDRCGKIVRCGTEDIAVFKRGGGFFAINNVCAHQHFSMLHEGILEGYTVTCPMHGWAYDFRTGRGTTGEGKVASYPVRVEGEDLLIGLPDGVA